MKEFTEMLEDAIDVADAEIALEDAERIGTIPLEQLAREMGFPLSDQSSAFTLLAEKDPVSALAVRGQVGEVFSCEEEWFREPKCCCSVVVGLGGGRDEGRALRWLKTSEEHRLVLLEPEPVRLAAWLETKGARGLLAQERCRVHLLDERTVGEVGRWLRNFDWEIRATKRCASRLAEVERLIAGEADGSSRIIDEFLRGGDLFYRNFYRNLHRLNGSRLGHALFGRFQGVPAILCGAGPSLEENLPLLAEMRDKALLIAAGSGLNALCAGGVTPHFAIGIDPHPPQLMRQLAQTGFEVATLYRQRWYPEALAACQGPRLYLNGAGGYPLVEWVEEELGIAGPILEEGPTALCLGLQVARALGCGPIRLAGVDLSLRGKQLYAPGVAHDPEEARGYTPAKWEAEARWINDHFPEAERLNELFGAVLPMDERVQAEILQAPVVDVALKPLLGQLDRSLQRCKELLSGSPSALQEVELMDEVAYQHILDPIKLCLPEIDWPSLRAIVVENQHVLRESHGPL